MNTPPTLQDEADVISNHNHCSHCVAAYSDTSEVQDELQTRKLDRTDAFYTAGHLQRRMRSGHKDVACSRIACTSYAIPVNLFKPDSRPDVL